MNIQQSHHPKFRGWFYALLTVILSFSAQNSQGQYYSWGADAPMKWSQLSTHDYHIIYPDSALGIARHTLHYLDNIRPYISHGFRHGAMPKMPFVLHGENFEANGLVMYMPRRVELLTIPSEDNYSMPWLKQLLAHEYRHTVQYNNLNRGVFRVLSYLTGQHTPTVSLLCMPAWALEGDAVVNETLMSSYGRGLQPSFTMAYRALGDKIGRNHRGKPAKNIDRWFSGSYRDFIPDHYALGYQICTYAYDRYGEVIWDKVARYGARNPYVFATVHKGLRKYYQTDVKTLFRETFTSLQEHWKTLPQVEDSHSPIRQLEEGNWTKYQHPQPLSDSTIFAVKFDFDRPIRFVEVNRYTGKETIIAHTGNLSSRPILHEGKVWWTEYRRSTLFNERVNSRLCVMDLKVEKPRPKTISKHRNILYPTPTSEEVGWITHSIDGTYTLCVNDLSLKEKWSHTFPLLTEIHGLAWDNATRQWAVLVTDDEGMHLSTVDPEGEHPLTQGRYITLSDLKAKDGKLYFGSIASGKDEVHLFDLKTHQESQISRSAYGAFDACPTRDGNHVLLTSYDHLGYQIREQDLAVNAPTPISPQSLPRNTVNPPRRLWSTINLDTVRFTMSDSLQQSRKHPHRRHRRALHAVNIHGWLPVSFDPFEAVDEHHVDLNLGVTLLSQNILSNTEGYLSYGWNQDEGSLWKTGLKYNGLGVELRAEFSWGGRQMCSSLVTRDPLTDEPLYQPLPSLKKHTSVSLGAVLPLYFQRGYHTRQLSLMAAWNYSNAKTARIDDIEWSLNEKGYHIANIEDIGYRTGQHKLSFGVGYADQVRMAYRDLAPRWGYQLSVNYALNPTDRNYADLISVYGHLFLPGIVRHHSLKLAATYQTSLGGNRFPGGTHPLTYRSSILIPRGYSTAHFLSEDYHAYSVNYQLPLWYPEGGIPSILYIKRIRLNLGGDFARFRLPFVGRDSHQNLWSVGCDLIFDFNVLRQPPSAMSTLKLSMFKPRHGKMWFTASLGLPF